MCYGFERMVSTSNSRNQISNGISPWHQGHSWGTYHYWSTHFKWGYHSSCPFGPGSNLKDFATSIYTQDVPFSYEKLFKRLIAHEDYLKCEEAHHEPLVSTANFTQKTPFKVCLISSWCIKLSFLYRLILIATKPFIRLL